MSLDDEDSAATFKESAVIRRRGRELAKLVGAVVIVLAALAMACRSLWDYRDEWPSWTVPDAVGPKVGPSSRDDRPLALGLGVYQARCVRCHGPDGHGDGPDVAKSPIRPRDLASASWHSGADRDAVRRVILEGTPDELMPGSAGAITPHELDSVVDYVLSLEMSDRLARAGIFPSLRESAPPLSFLDADGTVGSLDQFRGKVVLVAFWGTTCIPCIAELPELETLAGRYEKTDLVVLPVCLDETNAQTARDVAARHAPNLSVYVDSNGSILSRVFLM
jgi:mono/diheme cytochrome c family protein